MVRIKIQNFQSLSIIKIVYFMYAILYAKFVSSISKSNNTCSCKVLENDNLYFWDLKQRMIHVNGLNKYHKWITNTNGE